MRQALPLDGRCWHGLQVHFAQLYKGYSLCVAPGRGAGIQGDLMGRVMTILAVLGVLAATWLAYRYGVL